VLLLDIATQFMFVFIDGITPPNQIDVGNTGIDPSCTQAHDPSTVMSLRPIHGPFDVPLQLYIVFTQVPRLLTSYKGEAYDTSQPPKDKQMSLATNQDDILCTKRTHPTRLIYSNPTMHLIVG